MEKAKNSNDKVREAWTNCKELGRGGFGVFYKYIQQTKLSDTVAQLR